MIPDDAREEGEDWNSMGADELRALLARKEALLKEVHHRIKNSITTVTGILSLQAAYQADLRSAAALEDARGRIGIMQRVYEGLFRSEDFMEVPAGDFLGAVVGDACAAHEERLEAGVRLEKRFAEGRLDAKRLFPLGLVLYELVSNACRHAFPEGRRGLIEVILEAAPDGGFLLSVSDDGVGLPPEVDPDKPAKFGLTLAKALSEQVGGRLERAAGPGTRFRVALPPRQSS